MSWLVLALALLLALVLATRLVASFAGKGLVPDARGLADRARRGCESPRR